MDMTERNKARSNQYAVCLFFFKSIGVQYLCRTILIEVKKKRGTRAPTASLRPDPPRNNMPFLTARAFVATFFAPW